MVSTYVPDGLLTNRLAVLPPVPGRNQRPDETAQASQGSDVVITSKLVRQPPANGGGWMEQPLNTPRISTRVGAAAVN
jgi:hypothetical protein